MSHKIAKKTFRSSYLVHDLNKVALLAQAVGRFLENLPVMEHLGEVEATASAAFEQWGQKSQVEI